MLIRRSRIALLVGIGLNALLFGAAVGNGQMVSSENPDLLLARGRAGLVEIGMQVDELFRHVGSDNARLVALSRTGRFQPTLVVRLDGAWGHASVRAEVDTWPCGFWTIQSIELDDGRFRTTDGLGVGSRASALKRIPDLKVHAEEGQTLAVSDALGITFVLEPERSSHRPATDLDDDATVLQVRLWESPRAVRERRCPGIGRTKGSR